MSGLHHGRISLKLNEPGAMTVEDGPPPHWGKETLKGHNGRFLLWVVTLFFRVVPITTAKKISRHLT